QPRLPPAPLSPYTTLFRSQGAKLAGWNFEIIGTDISMDILDIARKAEYSQFEVQRGLPIQMLMKYFEQKGDKWALKSEIKSMVQDRKSTRLNSSHVKISYA